MNKQNKIIIALSLVIAMLVGYILGGGNSRSYALGEDLVYLKEMVEKAQLQIDKFNTTINTLSNIKNLSDDQVEEQISQTKLLAASIGNDDLLKLASQAEKVNKMKEGDWFKLIKNRLSDVIPGSIGKITVKETGGDTQQTKEWQATVDAFSGNKTKDTGIINEPHRYTLIGGVLDAAYNDVVRTYDIPVVKGGKLNNNNSQLVTGSLKNFIDDRKNLLRQYEEGLRIYGDKTPLQVQLQMLNQISLFQASINLKLLEAQVAANKISTLKEYVEFSENLRSKLKKSF